MAAGGRQKLIVKLDDGTGTYPHDISAYVDLSDSWSIKRGRGDEDDAQQAGELHLTLSNNDGRFTFGAGPYWVDRDHPIRVWEQVGAGALRLRFTGYVEEWPTEWEGPFGNIAVAKVTAYDRLPRLSRQKLRSMVAEEVLRDGPVAYYPLDEEEGTTSGGDASGNGQALLGQAGTGAPVSFGTGTGPGLEETKAAQFAGGRYLDGPVDNSTATQGSIVLECWVSRFGNPASDETLVRSSTRGGRSRVLTLGIHSTGRVTTTWLGSALDVPLGFLSSVVITDGKWHHLAVCLGPGSYELFIDGVSAGDRPSPGGTFVVERLMVGGAPDTPTATANIYGVAAYNDDQGLTSWGSRAADHTAASTTGFAGERSDDRFRRLAAYADLGAAALDIEAGVLDQTAAQSTSGSTPLDALTEVTKAEGGTAFVAADGRLAFQSRAHRPTAAAGSPALTLAPRQLAAPPSVSADKRYMKNTATGSRVGGPTQTVTDAPSRSRHGEYPDDESAASLLTLSDDDVLARLRWIITNGAEPGPRLATPIVVDLLALDAATQAAALQLELGSLVRLTGLFAQASATALDLIVEGIEEAGQVGEWTLALTVVPAESFRAWVLGDATYGVLGSTTKLYF